MDKVKELFKSRIIYLGFILLVLSSCTLRLISNYDEITDNKVTEIQGKFAQHFVKLERVIGTDESTYERFIPFYDEVKADLSTLKIRANSIDKNELVIKQLELLELSISDLEKLHKIGFKKPEEIVPIRNAFNSSFTAIIKFQMALKRGK
jgi:hypothetical protein